MQTHYGTSSGLNDYLNRIEAFKDGSTSLAAYTYLGMGMVIVIDYTEPDVKLDLWGGTSGTFDGFDRFGRIVDQRWRYYGGTPADRDRYKYGYDRDSNRQWKQNTVGSSLDEYYTYDNLNRLTSMQRGTLTGTPPTGISGTPVKEEDWTLDPTGNWSEYIQKTSGTTDLDQTRTANKVNEITGISETTGPSWVDPAYDAAGNTTTFPQGGDPTQSYTTTYDAWNRMVWVKDGSNFVAKYKYDGRMRRIIQETYTAGSLTETRHFYFTNDWQDIEERVGSSSSADVQYVWGIRYVDELVCRDDATPRRLYAMQDANFNLTGITDTSGAVVERYVYMPYGVRSIRNASWSVISSSAYAWAVGHQGLFHATDGFMVNNRNRVYSPLLGVFVQRDPLEYDGGIELYNYLANSPVDFLDALGLQTAGGTGVPAYLTQQILSMVAKGFSANKIVVALNFMVTAAIVATVIQNLSDQAVQDATKLKDEIDKRQKENRCKPCLCWFPALVMMKRTIDLLGKPSDWPSPSLFANHYQAAAHLLEFGEWQHRADINNFNVSQGRAKVPPNKGIDHLQEARNFCKGIFGGPGEKGTTAYKMLDDCLNKRGIYQAANQCSRPERAILRSVLGVADSIRPLCNRLFAPNILP